jgi:hypothetical protein
MTVQELIDLLSDPLIDRAATLKISTDGHPENYYEVVDVEVDEGLVVINTD